MPEPVRISTGMDIPSRMLWYFGWNQRPLYVAAAVFGVFGAVALQSIWGFLLALVPLAACYKAIAFVNNIAPSVLDVARKAIAKAELNGLVSLSKILSTS